MSRYLGVDCESFRRKYLDRFDKALDSIERNYRDMDFDNAREKEVDMRRELDDIKKQIENARSELLDMSFE